jgi:asparagine synthase (glutamine-hydrolysing)
MCGISGIVNLNNEVVSESSIKKMMIAMKHRGPDDEGIFIKDNIGLGFVRLSILDLSSQGHQPMHSTDERYVIIFNGEVYNYLEIKEELGEKYKFNSNTDTEVVLYAFIEWGENCLDKLNGMFAFVIFDRQSKSIFGARDRFGIKPFYYFLNNNQFVFASEIPPILEVADYTPKANDSIIFNYLLTNRTHFSDNTFFDKIKKLRPGSKFTLINSQLEIKNWYNIDNIPNQSGFLDSNEYKIAFEKSIKSQLCSDVPIGVCLSGGIDSSSITSVLLKNNSISNLHTYSSIYEKGSVGDEQEFIECFKDEALNMHFIKLTENDLLNDLDEYINAIGEPIPTTSEYAEFKLMQLAKNNSTVVLNGQGADEVVGGYDYFYAAYLIELLKRLQIIKFSIEAYYLFKFNKLFTTLKYFVFFILPTISQCYLFRKKNTYINSEFYTKFKPDALNLISNFYKFKSLKSFFINHLKYKFEHHLAWADKSGMQFSLETRFPFIDHNLIEKTLATNNNQLLNHGWTKKILRDAMVNDLNDKIRLRKDKVGFETPENVWLKKPEFQKFISEILDSAKFKKRIYFDHEEIKLKYNDFISGNNNESQAIWKVINLELWLRKFIDGRQPKYDHYYVIVTPIKNEEAFILKTINSVINQTILPKQWIIVDDGSNDDSVKIVGDKIEKYDWIKLITINNKDVVKEGGSKVVNAFNIGYNNLDFKDFEFIVKLDGDLELPSNYFEIMINEFKSDERLGICGGVILNRFSDDKLVIEKVADFHVRGALKMIRRKCWADIGGFKKIWFWDSLDIMEARFNNWITKSVNVKVIHNRPTSSSYDPIKHTYKCGYETYKLGANWKLTLLRALARAFIKPYFILSYKFLKGYLDAKKKQENIIVSDALAVFINKSQLSRVNPFKF